MNIITGYEPSVGQAIEAPPPPRPKRDDEIPPEAAEGMGLPLNDDERRKRVEALRRSRDQGEG